MNRIINISYSLLIIFFITSCCNEYDAQVTSFISNQGNFLNRNIKVLDERIKLISFTNESPELNIQTGLVLNRIDSLKNDIMELCGFYQETVKLERLMDHKIATKYMFEGKNSRSNNLKKLINNYKQFLSSLVNDDKSQKLIEKHLYTGNWIGEKKSQISWESHYFENIPIFECLVNLDKIEYEVKSAQLYVLTELNK